MSCRMLVLVFTGTYCLVRMRNSLTCTMLYHHVLVRTGMYHFARSCPGVQDSGCTPRTARAHPAPLQPSQPPVRPATGPSVPPHAPAALPALPAPAARPAAQAAFRVAYARRAAATPLSNVARAASRLVQAPRNRQGQGLCVVPEPVVGVDLCMCVCARALVYRVCMS
jgi:hypothetical protein